MMRFSIAINPAKEDSLAPAAVGARGYRVRVPAVDLGEYGFHLRIAQFVFRIPPIQSSERLIEWVVRCVRLRNQTQGQLMHKPCIGSTIAWRVNSLFPPLQESLSVSECAFLFRVTGRREEKHFSLDLLWFQLTALNLR